MTEYPPLLKLSQQIDYQSHFEATYCRGPIETFDGIQVRFRKSNFFHAFFESSHRKYRKDDVFSPARAERMDWIKAALEDPHADLRFGYDSTTRSEAKDRRVVIVKGNFVVVIVLISEMRANFITCFVATTRAVDQIRRSRKWPKKSEAQNGGGERA